MTSSRVFFGLLLFSLTGCGGQLLLGDWGGALTRDITCESGNPAYDFARARFTDPSVFLSIQEDEKTDAATVRHWCGRRIDEASLTGEYWDDTKRDLVLIGGTNPACPKEDLGNGTIVVTFTHGNLSGINSSLDVAFEGTAQVTPASGSAGPITCAITYTGNLKR